MASVKVAVCSQFVVQPSNIFGCPTIIEVEHFGITLENRKQFDFRGNLVPLMTTEESFQSA